MNTMQSEQPILQIQGVDVWFEQRQVLQDIQFAIEPGEFVGLIGPNGAGKTTLLNIILGLRHPQRGSVKIAGHTAKSGSQWVGYVPQKIHFDYDTPMRARDLVALGLDGHRFGIPLPSKTRQAKVDEVLAAVNALQFADAPIGRLSGGEQQRLFIAQALLTQPKILLLDEPLSNLDIRSAHEVVDLVSRISKSQGIAVLLVAHDMNPLLSAMDKIIYLAAGRAAMGTLDEVVQSEVLTKLYGYEVDVLRVRNRILVIRGDSKAEEWTEANCSSD